MKKVLKDLAPLALPHGPPVESSAEYFRSKSENKQVRKFPVWDVARPTPQVLMEQARRELVEVEQRLADKRIENEKFRKEMDEKWEHLRKKEIALKESFINFNKFIRENNEKRKRAERKIQDTIETLDKKTAETEEMKQRVDELNEIKEMIERIIVDYTIYEDYLMSVVENSTDFQQPTDILNRYDALIAAKRILASRQEQDLETLEQARSEVIRLTDEKKLMLMGFNNKLAVLRYRYDKAKSKVIKWESALNRLKETGAQKHIELCHVRSAIWCLYIKICRQKGIPVSAKQTDFESQLVIIMRALKELAEIYNIAKSRVEDSGQKDAEDFECPPPIDRTI